MKYCLLLLIIFMQTKVMAQKKTISLQQLCNDMSATYRTDKGFVGIAIGIIDGDSCYFVNYGNAQDSIEKKISQYTKFQIGSVTKVFTGIAITKLVDEGKLTLDDTYNSVVDAKYAFKSELCDNITIKQLLTHHSNLPKIPFNFNQKKRNELDPFAYYLEADLLQFLALYQPISHDRIEFQYTNINYALLGYVIASIAHTTAMQYIMSEIISPLALQNTAFQLHADTTVAAPHSYNGSPTNLWNFASMHTSGAMYSTTDDLLKLLSASWSIDIPYQKAWQPISTTNIKEVRYASGWQTYFRGKREAPIVTHSGATEGHRCYIGFVPASKKGIVVLSNSSNSPDQVGIDILGVICEFK